MNILFLSTWYPYPPDNGSKLRVYHLLRALSEAHAVTLASFAFDTARPDEPSDLRAWCQDVRVVALNPFAANRASTLRTFLSPGPVTSRSIPAMSHLVAHNLRSGTFDAIIASTETTAVYSVQTRKVLQGTARILELHNSLTRWMKGRYTEQGRSLQRLRCWASWQKTRRYEARLFGRFDLVTMVSEQDRRVCLTDLPGYQGGVEVVSNGVDCDYNLGGLTRSQPDTMVFNGSLTYSANYDAMQWFLAEIYPRIRARIPSASLVITGSTKGVSTAGLALDPSVRLTGYVEDVRLPVAEAAACVTPIRQGGGTRLKILEAMALGTPVVATSKAAEGLDVTDGEHLLLADSPESFARHTIELLGNPGLRSRLAGQARRLVEEHYDWQAIGARFVDLVETTVREKGGVGG
jgi:glycosyltransferase involved in cell wall biosynthesis